MSDWIAAINYLIVRYQKQFESPLALSVIWLLVAAEAAVSLLWIFLPTLLYRFSIKSTALIYLPFLLVIQSGTRRNVGFRHWLTEIQRSALETWRRLYAMATVFIFLVLPVWVLLFAHEVWMQLLDSRRSPMVAVVADLLFVVAGDTVTVHAWHVARIVSAAITMWLWWYASRVLVRLDFESVNTDRSEKLISGALVARGLLGLFTIASTLIILSRAASWLSMPSIRIDWWP